jgi:galactokinase
MTLIKKGILIDKLISLGFTECNANDQVFCIENAYKNFSKFNQTPFELLSCHWVPGILNIAGKHTGYAGGCSLNAPIDRGMLFLSTPREDNIVRLIASSEEAALFEIKEALSTAKGHWSDYCRKVIKRLQDDFDVTLRGVDIAFDSRLPSGCGLAASSNLICGFFKIFIEVNQLEKHALYQEYLTSDEAMATYLGCIEYDHAFFGKMDHLGSGVFGGCEQYTAMVCTAGNGLLESRFRPVVLGNHIPMPNGYSFVIGTTGVTTKVKHATVSQLKNIVKIASIIAEIWRQETGKAHRHLGEILDHDLESEAFLRDVFLETDDAVYTRDELSKRFEHFVSEHTQIVPAVITGLRRSSLDEVGLQLDRSHKLANLLLAIHVPQTNCLYATANEYGAVFVNTTGNGFGSAVWAMVETNEIESFLGKWQTRYETDFPEQKALATFFVAKTAPACLKIQ